MGAARLHARTMAGAVVCVFTLATGPGAVAQDTAILVGAGDIASCDSWGDEETAKLLDMIPGTVFTTGDNAYERGTRREFAACFGHSWGRHKARIRPSLGNHDYLTRGAAGYFGYFGSAGGTRGEGYYSYDLRDWHVVVLNSNCRPAGGCGPDSPQVRWLRADLAANSRLCTIAYWHHPRFSSGPHGNDRTVGTFWQILYTAGVEAVLNGHDHLYERFAPQTPAGVRDDVRGIQQFTIGTGGRSLYRPRTIRSNSIVRSSSTFGVLKLNLESAGYSWEFVAVRGGAKDKGSRRCH